MARDCCLKRVDRAVGARPARHEGRDAELARRARGGELAWSLAASAPLRAALLWTAAGLAAYGLSLLAWLAVLVRYRLSYAYPLLALSYVLVYIGATSWPELAEPATPQRTIGTLLILAGVALVSLTGERAGR